MYKLKNLIKVPTCLKIRTIPRLVIWCWETQSAVFKTHVHLKQVFLSFIKWQLLSLNHAWKRNNLNSYLVGTLGNSQTMSLEHKFWEIFQLCIYLVYVDICIRAFDIYAPILEPITVFLWIKPSLKQSWIAGV